MNPKLPEAPLEAWSPVVACFARPAGPRETATPRAARHRPARHPAAAIRRTAVTTSPVSTARAARAVLTPCLTVAAVVAGLAGAPVGALGQVDTLVSQPLSQSSGLNSNLATGSASRRAADDFTLPVGNGQPYTLRRVTGFMFTTLASDPELFRLEIYRDAGGGPGEPLLVRGAASMVLDWGQLQPGVFTRQAFFDFSATLDPGRYWLSVVGLTSETGAARFATSGWGGPAAAGSGAMVRSGSGPWTSATASVNPEFRDLAFSIYGAQAIPAPGAAALVAIGGALLARRRR